ncbi:MAG: IPExxxVDY family protein [Cyclobacteriaceae bacterium]
MFKLEVDYDFDFEVIGIVSSLKEYKLAYFINNTLNWSFFKDSDINIPFKKGELLFSNYTYNTPNHVISLIKNKSISSKTIINKPFLLPESKEFDYLLKIDGKSDEFDTSLIFDKIKEIPNIVLLKRKDIENLINKENLIF